MPAVSIDHYENFPVASALCPARLRPAVRAIYAYARTADDLADEGDADRLCRLGDLAAYREDLHAVLQGAAPSRRWSHVFLPLADAIRDYRLPGAPLEALLDAFVQDLTKHRYLDREELLAYCERSANPVGRLMLHLYGLDDEQARRESDAICTGLQLTNFWQDLRVDTARGRLYVPLDACRRHDVPPRRCSRTRRLRALRPCCASSSTGPSRCCAKARPSSGECRAAPGGNCASSSKGAADS